MATSPTHLSSTAQDYLDILDITNDILLLRDGSTAMVLKVSAINFGLLSEPEQDAIIYAYAALINSLSFQIQILIKSRPKDVTNYLRYVDEQLSQASSDIRRQQIASYRQFVANLITEQNVLDKAFYVVLPLSALELGLASAANPLGDFVPNKKAPEIDHTYVLEKSLTVLGPRRDHIIGQFGRIGLRAQQLDTKELIHMFFSIYNNEAAEGTRVVETREYTSALIQAQGTLPSAPQPSAPQPVPAEPPLVATTVAQPTSPLTPAPLPSAPTVLSTPTLTPPPQFASQPPSPLQTALSAVPQETPTAVAASTPTAPVLTQPR